MLNKESIKSFLGFALVLAMIGVTALGIYNQATHGNLLGDRSENVGEATRLCTTTQTVVAIGHQVSTRILGPGSRQWAIVQQPTSATNTVAISLDNASSTLARGYKLDRDTGTDVASSTDKLVIGYATDFPTSNFLEAITSTGSSTVTVIECK